MATGEAKEVDVGLAGGTPKNLVYVNGVPSQKFEQENLVDSLEQLIRKQAAEKEAKEKDIIAKV